MAEPTGPDISATGAGSPVAPAGAAPATPGTPAPSTPATPPAGFVPLDALKGEQEVARKAREETATLRAHMELQGFRFAEDGSVVPPQVQPTQPSMPRTPQAVEALATSLGVDPAALQGAIRETLAEQAPGYIEPLARSSFEGVKRNMAQDDRTFPIYAKSFEREVQTRVNSLPPQYQSMAWAHPQIIADARNAAVAAHLDEIVAKRIELAKNPGRVVGSFSEGAAPGSGQPEPPASYSPETVARMKQMGFTDEEIAKGAERREVSGRYVR